MKQIWDKCKLGQHTQQVKGPWWNELPWPALLDYFVAEVLWRRDVLKMAWMRRKMKEKVWQRWRMTIGGVWRKVEHLNFPYFHLAPCKTKSPDHVGEVGMETAGVVAVDCDDESVGVVTSNCRLECFVLICRVNCHLGLDFHENFHLVTGLLDLNLPVCCYLYWYCLVYCYPCSNLDHESKLHVHFHLDSSLDHESKFHVYLHP